MSFIKNRKNIWCGDCKELLKRIPDSSIDLVVTSPPYDNLRSYNNQNEFTFNDFKIVAKELKRVLKEGGVLVWVVGDAVINGSESGTSFAQALFFKEIGLNLHDTMIYQKSGFCYPAKKRYHQVFEYMFIISKGKPKTFNSIKDVECSCHKEKIRGSCRNKDGIITAKHNHGKGNVIAKYGKRTNIWKILNGFNKSTLDKIAFEHPAIFPDALARDQIISWSNPGDIVLDPFLGSGTVGKACKKLQRNFIGIDINPHYVSIAHERIFNLD